ncbi:hypothetical protein CRUP_022757 [Coryphaenoides rupestris]|nr:hypothetical protein CRUP_022757 [Coryphaenoides rupestris]
MGSTNASRKHITRVSCGEVMCVCDRVCGSAQRRPASPASKPTHLRAATRKILQVLQRDRMLRTVEEERIRRMKQDLQEIRRRGAKSFCRQYSERTCARCQRPLGKFWNCGEVCRGCSHRICSRCRVAGIAPAQAHTSAAFVAEWRCTVCHAYRDVRVRSGEWFLEERAKKFPIATEISKSQNDVRGDRLTVGNSTTTSDTTYHKSLSDTDINRALHLTRDRSLSSLLRWSKGPDQEASSPGAEEDLSLWTSGACSGKRGSNTSTTSADWGVSDGSQSVTGEVELALAYHDITSCLQVTVGGCRNVSDGKKKKCNLYVKIYLETDKAQASKRKTSVKRNTVNPVYNEVLQYQIARPLLSACTLRASVWHSGSLKRKSQRPVSPQGGALEPEKAELRVRLQLETTCGRSAAGGACWDSAQLLFEGLSRAAMADCVLLLDVWDHTHLAPTGRHLAGARLDANKIGLPWQTVLQTPNKWHDFSLPLVVTNARGM